MRIRLIAASAAVVILLGALGCGSYSAPNNPPAASDSTRDSTMAPGYDRS
jgi:hypothetical protein